MNSVWKTCSTLLRKNSNRILSVGSRRHSRKMSSTRVMIVGLGNLDHPKTRHSVGMSVADSIAELLSVRWERNRKLSAFIAHKELPDTNIILLKSKLPMNTNGRSVSKAASEFGVEPEHIYLLHDELDKTVGKYSMKEGGSARGHNGVRSCIAQLKTDAIPRMRIGVDRPTRKDDVADYVLSAFTNEQKQTLDSVTDACIKELFRHIQTRTGVDVLSITARDTTKG